MRGPAAVGVTLLVVSLTACGSSGASIDAAATTCDVADALENDVLHLSDERDHGQEDVDCVLKELADAESTEYLQGSDVPAAGEREINDGVWTAWEFGPDSTFTVKVATSRAAATI